MCLWRCTMFLDTFLDGGSKESNANFNPVFFFFLMPLLTSNHGSEVFITNVTQVTTFWAREEMDPEAWVLK